MAVCTYHSMSCTNNITPTSSFSLVLIPLTHLPSPLSLSPLSISLSSSFCSPLSLFSPSSLFHSHKEGCTKNNGVVFAHKVPQYSRWVSSNHLKSWEDEVTTLEEVYDLGSCIVSEVTIGEENKMKDGELGGWEGREGGGGEGKLFWFCSHFCDQWYCYEQPCMPHYQQYEIEQQLSQQGVT